MKALSALAKFSGCYTRYKNMIKSYGLKWSTNNDDIIIARLIKYSNSRNGYGNELFDWIKQVKQKIPAFSTFMDFILITGLRLDEAIRSYSLITQLVNQGKLHQYYDLERQVLEHFKFKELFIRRTKKTFMSFVSNELIGRIVASGLEVSQDVIRKRMQRAKFKLHFSDLRELWASRSVKHLRQPEIDFLQGRVSTSVFMTNYFNPTWITDLQKRAIDNANELLSVLS